MEEKFWHAEGQEVGKNLPHQTRRDLSSTSSADNALAGFDIGRAAKHTLGKAEKLKSQKIIDNLFNEGKAVSHNGFTLVYLFIPLHTIYPAQVSFSVPKRNFKHAHDRNRIKRLLREAYRLNKHPLYAMLATQHQQIAMMWVYKGRSLPDYETVTKEVLYCLGKLVK